MEIRNLIPQFLSPLKFGVFHYLIGLVFALAHVKKCNLIFPHTLPVFPISANEYILSTHLHKSENQKLFTNPFFQQIFIGCLPLFRLFFDCTGSLSLCQAFSSCRSEGYSLNCNGHSCCGAWAQLLPGTWESSGTRDRICAS